MVLHSHFLSIIYCTVSTNLSHRDACRWKVSARKCTRAGGRIASRSSRVASASSRSDSSGRSSSRLSSSQPTSPPSLRWGDHLFNKDRFLCLGHSFPCRQCRSRFTYYILEVGKQAFYILEIYSKLVTVKDTKSVVTIKYSVLTWTPLCFWSTRAVSSKKRPHHLHCYM